MINPDSIPDLWKNARSELETIFGEAYIAGGALRDLDNFDGDLSQVNDIDIFVPSKGHAELLFNEVADLRYTLESSFEDYFVEMLSQEQIKEYDINLTQINCIFRCVPEDCTNKWSGAGHRPKEYKEIQIIVMDVAELSMVDLVERFDMSFCRVAYDGMHFLFNEAYARDQRVQQFTLLHCHWRESSLRRAQNFLDGKYQGWHFVDLFAGMSEEDLKIMQMGGIS